MENKIYAVTVTYNPDISLLTRQIVSLKGQVAKVIVVDNDSSNISEILQICEAENSFADTIVCTENMGIGHAQNLGIKLAKSHECTHVILLDQDSILKSDFVSNMIISERELNRLTFKVGAIGPVYFNEKTGEIYPITKYKGPFIERIVPNGQPAEATFLIASGCFIPISVIDDVGMMNEDLFIDYVDVEWCFRAKSLGYQLFADPNISMSHTIGDKRASVFGRTISVHSPLRRYYLYRNSIYMVKNKSIYFGYKLREVSFNLLRLIVFLVLADEKKKYFKYSLKGFSDGFKGVVGRCPHQF